MERRLTPSEVSKPRENKARASDFSDTGRWWEKGEEKKEIEVPQCLLAYLEQGKV